MSLLQGDAGGSIAIISTDPFDSPISSKAYLKAISVSDLSSLPHMPPGKAIRPA